MKSSETRESLSLWSVQWPCNLHPQDAQVVPVLLKNDRGIEKSFYLCLQLVRTALGYEFNGADVAAFSISYLKRIVAIIPLSSWFNR
jgi:hypothetical protein